MADLNGRPVRALQTYLREINRANNRSYAGFTNGVFGERTEQAVKDFQKDHGMPQTGEVDNDTWNKIVEEYQAIMHRKAMPKQLTVFPAPDYVIKIGHEAYPVEIFKVITNALSDKFSNIDHVGNGKTYDQKSSDSVKKIQGISGRPQTGNLDKDTWNDLADLYHGFVNLFGQM